MEAAFVLGVIFAFIVLLVWLNNRKKERMFLLQIGKDPNLADSKNKIFSSVNYLKWGIIVASIGLGMLAGSLVGSLNINRYDSLYLACLFIFGGIGVIASFLVMRHISDSDKQSEKETDTTK